MTVFSLAFFTDAPKNFLSNDASLHQASGNLSVLRYNLKLIP